MANLVQTILSSLPDNSDELLGSALGDSPGGIRKGLSAILPLLLSSFAGKAASGADLGGLLSTVSGALSRGNPLENPAALLSGGAPADGAGGLAQMLLGSNAGPVSSTIASLFGLKGGTVNSLLALAGPLISGGLGKVLGASPTVTGLRNLLVSEKESYAAALPPELQRFAAPSAAKTASAAPYVVETQERRSGLWKWVLLGLALLALLGWLLARTNKADLAVPPSKPVAMDAAPLQPAAVPAGAGVMTEDRAGKPALIVFFEVGQSRVSNDLATSSAAVKAYADSHPGARISVSGFNDPTGDAAANAELSKNRAEQVKAALVAAGFDAEKIDLDKPADATDNSENYSAARRVEITIKE